MGDHIFIASIRVVFENRFWCMWKWLGMYSINSRLLCGEYSPLCVKLTTLIIWQGQSSPGRMSIFPRETFLRQNLSSRSTARLEGYRLGFPKQRCGTLAFSKTISIFLLFAQITAYRDKRKSCFFWEPILAVQVSLINPFCFGRFLLLSEWTQLSERQHSWLTPICWMLPLPLPRAGIGVISFSSTVKPVLRNHLFY